MNDVMGGDSKTYTVAVEVGPVYGICWGAGERVVGRFGPIEVEP
jgi:hypothetical protein